MGRRWKTRTSMLTRLSALFCALVAVPLAITGVVLSYVGHRTVLRSADDLTDTGRVALYRTSEELARIVRQNMESTAGEMVRLGNQALQSAAGEHSRMTRQTLAQVTRRLMRKGNTAFEQASKRIKARGNEQFARARRAMESAYADSLEELTAKYLELANQNVIPVANQIRGEVRETLLNANRQLAAQRLARIISTAQRGIDDLSAHLAWTSLYGSVQQLHEERSPAQIERMIDSQSATELAIVRAILVNELGQEVVRCYGREFKHLANTETAENWKENEHFRRLQPSGEGQPSKTNHQVTHIATDNAAGTATLRLLQIVIPYGDDDPNQVGMLIADVSLRDVVPRALRTFRQQLAKDDLALLVSNQGSVISASDPALLGQKLDYLLPQLHRAITETERAPADEAELDFRHPTLGPMLGMVRWWAPFDAYAIYAIPEVQALQPLEEITAQAQRVLSNALSKVKSQSPSVVAGRMRKVEARQREIGEILRRTLDQELRRAQTTIRQELKREQEEELAGALAQIDAGSKEALAGPLEDIRTSTRTLMGDATQKMHGASQAQVGAIAQSLQQSARRIANSAARNISVYTVGLASLFLLAALVFAVLTARSLVRPINSLLKGTQALAEGNYSQRIPVRGDDELARLAAAFNHMAGAIERAQADLQQSHDSLAAEKSRIQAILHHSPDGLVMVEPNGEIAFVNPAALCWLSGNSQLPVACNGGPPHLSETAQARLRECLTAARSGEQPVVIEYREPERLVLQLRSAELRSPSGRPLGQLLHLHDITRERQIDEMKNDFISLVSHELRTPLTSILGFSSYMLSGKLGALSEAQRTALESVHRQARRLAAIISDFLDVSRIESGKIEMKKEPVALAHIARRVVEDLRPQAAEKHLRLEVEVAETAGPVVALGDEQRLAQVFTNLLGNAIKFTERDGAVFIRILPRGDDILCQVEDTGCGIPPEELPKVFDRFYQVEKVVTRKSGGTGLGLAIVKNIIEAHGGRIWIESELGRGTRVSFLVPAAHLAATVASARN